MSANGSVIVATPVCAAGLILAQPLHPPTICVRAEALVVIAPPPFVLMADDEVELTNTPHPLVSAAEPLIESELSAVGSSVMTQPPALASRVPVVARAVTAVLGKPRTA